MFDQPREWWFCLWRLNFHGKMLITYKAKTFINEINHCSFYVDSYNIGKYIKPQQNYFESWYAMFTKGDHKTIKEEN